MTVLMRAGIILGMAQAATAWIADLEHVVLRSVDVVLVLGVVVT